MLKKSKVAVWIILLALIPACDQARKLDNMNHNTEEMNGTTKNLFTETKTGLDKSVKKVDEMKVSTEAKMVQQLGMSKEIIDISKEIFDQGRVATAAKERRENIQLVKSSRTMTEKINAATKYLMAFEYQLFTGLGLDKDLENRREALKSDAVRDFFSEVAKFRIWSSEVDPFASRSVETSERNMIEEEENLDASFNAIAAALHEVNRIQSERIKSMKGVQTESMLTLIKEGLMAGSDVNSGKLPAEKLPEWKGYVLANKKLAIRLLQTRHNILPLIALSNVLPATDTGFNGNNCIFKTICANGIKQFFIIQGAPLHYDFDMNKYDLKELTTISELLKLTIETRQILKVNLVIEPKVHPGVKSMLNNLNLITDPKVSAPVAAIQTAIIGFMGTLKK